MEPRKEKNLAEVALLLEELQAEAHDLSEDKLYVLTKDGIKILL